jgi:cytochrome P450
VTVPEIDPADPGVLLDPFTAYGKARDQSPLARMRIPGMGTLWLVTRYESARAMLNDTRFEINTNSFMRPPGIPEKYSRYMTTMSEMDGPDHLRLRRLVAPAFTPRRAAEFRPRIEAIVDGLLDELPAGEVDLVRDFAKPLPMDVICELVGIPGSERADWREFGAAVASGHGQAFAEAIPAVMDGTIAVIELRRAEPADDVISLLIQAEDEDRLTDGEIVTLLWHLLLAGQVPTHLITNAVEALLTHPGQFAALRADPGLMPKAIDELMRFCSPQLLTIPRYAKQDVEIDGVLIRAGEPVSAVMVSANRDPHVFTDPETLDVTRAAAGHLGFGHGPHFCLGASLARVQTEIALTGLFRRFPDLALAEGAQRTPDGGTWRLGTLPVTLRPVKGS